MNTNQKLKHSANGITYSVIQNNDPIRPYGISAELDEDNTDMAAAENLFFTEAEADHLCKWLAENEVYPITLAEVLENLYTI